MVADADLWGEIEIGSGTVIHPRCKIDASLGAIRLGQNCVVEEGAELISTPSGMTVGDGNVFRTRCHVSSTTIGSNSTFESACRVSANVTVGDFCTVGAGCRVGADGVPDALVERTVVYGDGTRRVWSGEGVGQQLALHAKHLVYLRDMLPRAHKLRIVR